MIRFVFAFAYCVLSFSTVPVVGQGTVCSCTASVSGSDEKLQVSLKDHYQILETMNQNMCSAFDRLEVAVNRTNIKGQEVLCKDLTKIFHNMSVNLERVSEKIPERPECQATQDQEEYSSSMNFSLISMILRTDDRIQAVNKNIMNVYQNLSSTLQTASRNLNDKFQVMNESVVGTLREHGQKLQVLNETLSSAIDQINEKLNAILNHVNETLQYSKSQAIVDVCRNDSAVCDCSDIKANGYTASGVYRIYVVDEGQRYYANASCDMTTTNGAWTVFQIRKDGSVDFYRGWNEYANGFGNPSGEFWLGINFLHLLTSKRRYRLRIDLEDFEGGKRYAEYLIFNISSSTDKHRLRIGNYSGTAGDSLTYHDGQRFSTKDSDNDAYTSANLAVMYHAAWWYPDGHSSNLNGLYLRGPYTLTSCSPTCYEGIEWYGWRGHAYSLKTTEMKISPL